PKTRDRVAVVLAHVDCDLPVGGEKGTVVSFMVSGIGGGWWFIVGFVGLVPPALPSAMTGLSGFLSER
ncbi:MAG: hypothetical protein ABIT37_21100, partial [Luteolibacter sp.]